MVVCGVLFGVVGVVRDLGGWGALGGSVLLMGGCAGGRFYYTTLDLCVLICVIGLWA